MMLVFLGGAKPPTSPLFAPMAKRNPQDVKDPNKLFIFKSSKKTKKNTYTTKPIHFSFYSESKNKCNGTGDE